MDLIAIVATLCLTICPIPQTLRCIRQGNSDGLAGAGLLLWLVGGSLMLVYLLCTPGSDVYVTINFAMSVAMSSVQNFYKRFPRR